MPFDPHLPDEMRKALRNALASKRSIASSMAKRPHPSLGAGSVQLRSTAQMTNRSPQHRKYRLAVIAAARLLWCGVGAAVSLGLVLYFVNPPTDLLLLASFGGTAVFLFGLTRAPAAQPRSLFGGHLGG